MSRKMLDLQTAFDIHVRGNPRLTRRAVIHIADDCAMSPREAVAALEREGLAKNGSWDWFAANGGITSAQVDQIRAERKQTPIRRRAKRMNKIDITDTHKTLNRIAQIIAGETHPEPVYVVRASEILEEFDVTPKEGEADDT